MYIIVYYSKVLSMLQERYAKYYIYKHDKKRTIVYPSQTSKVATYFFILMAKFLSLKLHVLLNIRK